MAYYSTLDFSKIFNYFAKKITTCKLKKDEDTEMLFTRYKNIDEINNYVSSHFKNKTGFYIHNQDVAIVQIIEEAIYHFKNPDQQQGCDQGCPGMPGAMSNLMPDLVSGI